MTFSEYDCSPLVSLWRFSRPSQLSPEKSLELSCFVFVLCYASPLEEKPALYSAKFLAIHSKNVKVSGMIIGLKGMKNDIGRHYDYPISIFGGLGGHGLILGSNCEFCAQNSSSIFTCPCVGTNVRSL